MADPNRPGPSKKNLTRLRSKIIDPDPSLAATIGQCKIVGSKISSELNTKIQKGLYLIAATLCESMLKE